MFINKERVAADNLPLNGIAPGRVIVLTCFERGGSSVVWRMIGSSPDVIKKTEEWHVAVSGQNRILRKVSKCAFKFPRLRSTELLRSYAFSRTLSMRSAADMSASKGAASCVIKLMDYHIVFGEMIRCSFTKSVFVVLAGHPYGLCESLMRSGLSLEEAVRWYCDVAGLMADCAPDPGAIIIRFEDVIARRIEICDRLGVRWAEDRRFIIKIKPYGVSRTAITDVSQGRVIRVGAETAEHHVDASVLDRSWRRLSVNERETIWEQTRKAASKSGYNKTYVMSANDS